MQTRAIFVQYRSRTVCGLADFNAPLPHQRELGNPRSMVARTPRRRSRDTSRSCAHRDRCCTAGDRRASGPVPADGRQSSSAAAASSTTHRCSGQGRRLRACLHRPLCGINPPPSSTRRSRRIAGNFCDRDEKSGGGDEVRIGQPCCSSAPRSGHGSPTMMVSGRCGSSCSALTVMRNRSRQARAVSSSIFFS